MKNIYFLTICLLLNAVIKAQQNDDPEKALILEASYTGDIVNNLSGGLKTGHCYLGMANVCLGFDVEKAGFWKGGMFYINAANTHGSTPSAIMLGDMQVASNIEAGNHTYIQELWYKQSIGRIELTAGLQDLNVEFANSDLGALYLNSSFGILPVISGNLAAPIFPLTSLGLTVRWNITEKTTWINALYDGSPTDFDSNPYNIKWEFQSGDGILAITEFQHHQEINNLKGIYKLGFFSHNLFFESTLQSDFPDSLNNSIIGAYFYIDQQFWKQKDKSIGAFLHLGYSPSEMSKNNAYLGLGINFNGYLSRAKNDILGIAVAYEHFVEGIGCETAIELTWNKIIHKDIYIQPDLQYIIHPSGTKNNLKNCLAATLRLGMSF
ncbi:MAG: carbohydrate porin [Bacteroidales bacterium]